MEHQILLLSITIIFYCATTSGIDVHVSVNMDYIHAGTPRLKIYQRNIDVSSCDILEQSEQYIYLKLQPDLKSTICDTGVVKFYIFTYYSNIYTALVTIVNQNNNSQQLRSVLSQVSQSFIILAIQPGYAIIVKCQDSKMYFTDCQYKSVDQRAAILGSNFTVYSACNDMSGTRTCLTELEFVPETNDVDSKQELLGSKINVKRSTLQRDNKVPLSCLNGGILKKDIQSEKMRCVCPPTDRFYVSGPRCEVIQQAIKWRQFLYVLPNTDHLVLEFSIFSPAYNGETEIFRTENAARKISMKYNIKDTIHFYTILEQVISLEYSLDKPNVNQWLDVYIEVTEKNIILRINEKEAIVHFSVLPATPFLLDTFPLILVNNVSLESPSICLSNLKINFRIIDLNTPNYLSCSKKGCETCSDKQQCVFYPLKSKDNGKCICKQRLISLPNGTCVENGLEIGQLTKNMEKLIISSINLEFAIFKFRTLLNTGVLASLNFTSFFIHLKIENGQIGSSLEFDNVKILTQIANNNASNGDWHFVQIKLNNYSIELQIDDNIPYNTQTTWFDQNAKTKLSENKLVSINLGPLNEITETNSNLSVCFDDITVFTDKFKWLVPKIIHVTSDLLKGCDNGINCDSLNCTGDRKCSPKWQNSSCICDDYFTDVNGLCLFTKCIENPCKNKGKCIFSSSTKDYQCVCVDQYKGRNCEIGIALAILAWWIILIIVLIILIILVILIFICICRRKRKSSKNVADINQVFENVVTYNNPSGEADYTGPPINYKIMLNEIDPKYSIAKDETDHTHPPIIIDKQLKNADPKLPPKKASHNIPAELMARKQYYDSTDPDLIIDHPLDYAYEGFNSDAESVSSFNSNYSDQQSSRRPQQTRGSNVII